MLNIYEYGQLNVLPDSSISRNSVSIGVLPTSRTKNSCSITAALIVRKLGNRNNSRPNRFDCDEYWMRQYSSSAVCTLSCTVSTRATSARPGASVEYVNENRHTLVPTRVWQSKPYICVLSLTSLSYGSGCCSRLDRTSSKTH